jgi:hypothetical protein
VRDEVRTAVAFIVAKASGERGSSVYDYAASRYSHFSGTVDKAVSIYDHSCRSHITGHLPNLYHYLTKGHISLNITGNSFNGYDYDSRKHFMGTVRRSNVQIYDYDTSRYYQFVLA